jgi:hypothetical protein
MDEYRVFSNKTCMVFCCKGGSAVNIIKVVKLLIFLLNAKRKVLRLAIGVNVMHLTIKKCKFPSIGDYRTKSPFNAGVPEY